MHKFKRLVWWIGVIFFWPLVIAVEGFRARQRSIGKRILAVFTSLVLGFFWMGALVTIGAAIYLKLPAKVKPRNATTVQTRGPSMLPTLQLEDSVVEYDPSIQPINRGDLASFSNVETQGDNYLKRVVGLPGETVVIKNGTVWIDGRPLSEPYIYHQDKTYGNTFATECESYTIPNNSYFLMGDNRAVSWDSRALGYVAFEDLKGIVYRNDGPTFSSQTMSPLEKKEFSASRMVAMLNEARKEGSRKSLFLSKTLTELAQKRSDLISRDLEAWKKQATPLDTFLSQEQYRHNLSYEYVTFGYLDEAQLLQQAGEIPFDSDNFLSESFTEVGVGVTTITKGDCSYPLVVVLLSWPSEPSYSDETIAYWKRESTTLRTSLANLQSWVGFSEYKDQVLLKKAIDLNAEMAEISLRVAGKMSRKEWLSERDHSDIQRYQKMVTDHNRHLDELFPDIKGAQTEFLFPEFW